MMPFLLILLSVYVQIMPAHAQTNACSQQLSTPQATSVLSPAQVRLFHLGHLRHAIFTAMQVKDTQIAEAHQKALRALFNSANGFPASPEEKSLATNLKVMFENSNLHLPFDAQQIVQAHQEREADRPEKWGVVQRAFTRAVQLQIIHEFWLQAQDHPTYSKNPIPKPISEFYQKLNLNVVGDAYFLLKTAVQSPHQPF